MIDEILEEGKSEFDQFVDNFHAHYKEHGNIDSALDHATTKIEFLDRAHPIKNATAISAILGATAPFPGPGQTVGLATGGILATISAAKYFRNRVNDDRILRFKQYVGSEGVKQKAKNNPDFALYRPDPLSENPSKEELAHYKKHTKKLDRFINHVKQTKNAITSARIITQGDKPYLGKTPIPFKTGGIAHANIIPHNSQQLDKFLTNIGVPSQINMKSKPKSKKDTPKGLPIYSTGRQPVIKESILNALLEGEVIPVDFSKRRTAPNPVPSTSSADVHNFPKTDISDQFHSTEEQLYSKTGEHLGFRTSVHDKTTGLTSITTHLNDGKHIFNPAAYKVHYPGGINELNDHIANGQKIGPYGEISPGHSEAVKYTTVLINGKHAHIFPHVDTTEVLHDALPELKTPTSRRQRFIQNTVLRYVQSRE